MSPKVRLLVLFVSVTLVVPGFAEVPASPAEALDSKSTDEMQPKFVWGVVIKIAAKYALSYFAEYQLKKLTKALTNESLDALAKRSLSAQIVRFSSIQNALAMNLNKQAPNTVAGTSTVPLRIVQGHENFQAVHVALMEFDRQGQALGFRAVDTGFKTGERFRLRILPTFDGIIIIDNINPLGERKQIYPPDSGDVVQVKAGIEIMLPLGKDDYFQFSGATGDEQLVVALSDLRAVGSAASRSQVLRKDEPDGSNFMQELLPGTFPVIVQTLRLRHEAARNN
jgi:hypothetical protein